MTKMASRQSFGETLLSLGEKYPEVVCFDADLSKSTMSYLFAKKYPHRFFEMGIQEANMIGCAAGMSFMGKIPFICSFGAFLTGRYDQIRMSIGYAEANVKLIGTHSGVGIGEDGHSQMGLEDLGLMRGIPGMVVLQPSDDKETREMIEWSINHKGPVYLRLTRQALQLYQMDNFKPGFYPEVKKGKDIAIISSAGTLEFSVEAANTLEASGKLNPAVFNGSTIKPLNSDFLKSALSQYSTWIVVEDHSIIGGLGSALCEWVAESSDKKIKVIRYGVKDVFGESGTPKALYVKHGLTKEALTGFIDKHFS